MRQLTVRAGNAQPFVGVIRSLGGDVPALLEMAGLPHDALNHPERALSLQSIDRFLTRAEAATGCDHLGLLAGAQQADLGLPSFLFFNAPNLQTGLEDVIALVGLMHEGGSFSLQESADYASVRYTNVAPMLKGTRHITDCAVAQLHGALVRYCGPQFFADEIRLPRRAPADVEPYRKHFGRAKVKFNADEAAIEFPRKYLNHTSVNANQSLYRFLKSKVEVLSAEQPLAIRLKRIISVMILDGPVRLESLADKLGVLPKKLQRSLASDGLTIQNLVTETRHETALQLLQNTDLTVGEIAVAVGYSDTSSFTRSVRLREGISPKEFRERQGKRVGEQPDE